MFKKMSIICLFLSLSVTYSVCAQSLDKNKAVGIINPQQGKKIDYTEFLERKENPETVILDSYKLEPFLHISPPEVAEKENNSITQAQFEKLLSDLIPKKDSPVILFCWENFQPTRMMSARSSIGYALEKNGYSNILYLKDLWRNDNMFSKTEERSDQEKIIRSSATPIPDFASFKSSVQAK